jgi:hypothetical protein
MIIHFSFVSFVKGEEGERHHLAGYPGGAEESGTAIL